MKILAFVDLHGSNEDLKILLKKVRGADIIVCAGDISNWGQKTEELLTKFSKSGILMLIIPGNHEFDEELREVCARFDNVLDIHRAHYEIGDYIFFGYGGGGFALENTEFERISEKFMKNIKMRETKKIILVTHGPPYGTNLDFIPGLGYRGCKSIRKFIERYQPKLNICGHLHEARRMSDKIGSTLIVNPGPSGCVIKM